MNKEIKILVVDDFATMRKIVTGMLLKIGLSNITEADSGLTGWETVQASGPYDLIISDVNMPDMDGIEFLEKVRGDSQHSPTKFLLLTAENDQEYIIASREFKVDGYILKPFKQDLIEAKIVSLFP
jgi:two-component system chemotaxis response regulator CheY